MQLQPCVGSPSGRSAAQWRSCPSPRLPRATVKGWPAHRRGRAARAGGSGGQLVHDSPAAAAPVHPASNAPPASASPASSSRRRLLLGAAVGAVGLLGLGTSPLAALAAEGATTVFVAGATGATGRRVVQQLRQQGYIVRAGVRDTAKALALGLGADPGVTVVEADVTSSPQVLAAAMGSATAVVCATGFGGFSLGGAGPAQVDKQGTINLVEAAKLVGARRFVLVSSLLTNAAAVGQQTNPNYLFLNALGGILDAKLKAEQYLRASGLDYTIVRPGGLSNDTPEEVGNLIVSKEDTLFGLDSDPGRRISRDTVAAVVVAALQQPAASNKVLEVVSSPAAPQVPREQWFDGL